MELASPRGLNSADDEEGTGEQYEGVEQRWFDTERGLAVLVGSRIDGAVVERSGEEGREDGEVEQDEQP